MPVSLWPVVPDYLYRFNNFSDTHDSLECQRAHSFCNLMCQLVSISNNIESIFYKLNEDIDSLANRRKEISRRLGVISEVINKESSNEKNIDSSCFSDVKEWQLNITIGAPTVARKTIPKPIAVLYNECVPNPDISILDSFRTDKVKSSTLYSDPNFFFNQWMSSFEKQFENKKSKKQDRKTQKTTKETTRVKSITDKGTKKGKNAKKSSTVAKNKKNDENIQDNSNRVFETESRQETVSQKHVGSKNKKQAATPKPKAAVPADNYANESKIDSFSTLDSEVSTDQMNVPAPPAQPNIPGRTSTAGSSNLLYNKKGSSFTAPPSSTPTIATSGAVPPPPPPIAPPTSMRGSEITSLTRDKASSSNVLSAHSESGIPPRTVSEAAKKTMPAPVPPKPKKSSVQAIESSSDVDIPMSDLVITSEEEPDFSDRSDDVHLEKSAPVPAPLAPPPAPMAAPPAPVAAPPAPIAAPAAPLAPPPAPIAAPPAPLAPPPPSAPRAPTLDPSGKSVPPPQFEIMEVKSTTEKAAFADSNKKKAPIAFTSGTSDLLASIKMGRQLNKVTNVEKKAVDEFAGNDVASILARRIQLVGDSDSEDDDMDDDDDWD